MAKKVITNTFKNGLVMDFSPENTPEASLTNALNATLLTYNGNELSLQNDMGNGRVETAFLPEGYAPVGTCEFGGVIYIVSYNPLEDKCQIGCFPSPERNITSDELSDITGLTLKTSDFLELNNSQPNGRIKSLALKVIIRDTNLNPGDKYIIYLNRLSGYTQNEVDSITNLHIEGDGLENKHKKINLHIVSIDDSGKITYLDTETKEYDITSANGRDTCKYKLPIKNDNLIYQTGLDIDEYRKLVKQTYSVFSSKVPGKLAILAELETINEFSCGHRVETQTTDTSVTYKIYLDFSWKADYDDIYPSKVLVTKMDWSSASNSSDPSIPIYNFEYLEEGGTRKDGYKIKLLPNENYNNNYYLVNEDTGTIEISVPYLAEENSTFENGKCSYYEITPKISGEENYYNEVIEYTHLKNNKKAIHFVSLRDSDSDIILGTDIGDVALNNIFETNSTFYLGSFTVPRYVKMKNGTKLFTLPAKLKYTVIPAMSFGILDHLVVENVIDFSLIGTKKIELTGYKYFISNDYLTLNIDSDIYEEENHKINEIFIEFFDHAGFVGSYRINNRDSYTGNYVVDLALNSKLLLPYNLLDYLEGGTDRIRYHNVGINLRKDGAINTENIDASYNKDYAYVESNDIGILFSGMLYGVRISYCYAQTDPIKKQVVGIKESEGAEWIKKVRWMYTTAQFNDYYYSVGDYDSINNTIDLSYSYRIKDNTRKTQIPTLDLRSSDALNSLLNPDVFDANPDFRDGEADAITLETQTKYSGDLDVQVYLGTPKDSLFALKLNGSFSPEIALTLLNSEGEDSTGQKKNYSILEAKEGEGTQNSKEEEDETNQPTKYEGEDPVTQFHLQGLISDSWTGSVNKSDYSVSTKINVEVSPKFKSKVTRLRRETKLATVLTNICYNVGGGYNYGDIGLAGDNPTFYQSLVANYSDDPNDKWPQGWFKASIGPNGTITTNTSLYSDRDARQSDHNLYSGHEKLVGYYTSLGNRQPISLFTVQSGVGLYSDKGDEISDWLTINLSTSVSTKKRVIYTTNSGHEGWTMNDTTKTTRDYLPLLITESNANGGGEALMCSAGGWEGSSKTTSKIIYRDSGRYGNETRDFGSTIYYTSIRGINLYRQFCLSYANVMKLLITVNPDNQAVSSYTGDFDETQVKDQIISSYLVAALVGGYDKDVDYSNSILFNGVDFKQYIENVLHFVGNQQTLSTPNVTVYFNSDSCGDKSTLVLITPIQYRMKHEHTIIESYLNNDDLTVYLKFSDIDGSITNYNISGNVDQSRFYVWLDNNLYCLSTGNFYTDSYGNITANTYGMYESGGNVKYYPPKSLTYYNNNDKYERSVNGNILSSSQAIFPNSSFIIEDFTWDPSNKNHHMYFVNTQACLPVSADYAYLMDDDLDSAKKSSKSGIFKYCIGPSFNALNF